MISSNDKIKISDNIYMDKTTNNNEKVTIERQKRTLKVLNKINLNKIKDEFPDKIDLIDKKPKDWLDIYNKKIIKENKLKKEKKRLIINEKAKKKRLFKKNMNNLISNINSGIEDHNIKINDNNELRKVFDKLISLDKKILIHINENLRVLNDKTISILDGELFGGVSYQAQQNGNNPSDAEYIEVLHKGIKNLKITIAKDNGTYKKHEGSFFKYTNPTPIDLTKYQIFNEFNAKNYDENCFIYSLCQMKLQESIIKSISSKIIGRCVPVCKLKEIAEHHNLYITVKTRGIPNNCHSKGEIKIRKFGDKKNFHIPLCVIDDHYFILEKTNITSYAVKNYKSIQNRERWENFINDKERSTKRYMNSFDLIELMKDLNYFKPIEKTTETMSSIYYERAIEINELEEATENNTRLNDNEEKQKNKNQYENVFFDFETITTEEIHIPYLCCIQGDTFKKTFYGENCGRSMLLYLCDRQKDVRLIAHNAGYDVRFIYKYLYRFSMIDRGHYLLRGYGKYFNFKNQSINVEIQDSYAIITNPLKSFGKMFNLKIHKEFMPYDLYTKENVSKRYLPIEEIKIDDSEDKQLFYENCDKWNCIQNKAVDIIKYSEEYCKIDCDVLYQGYNLFRSWILEICNIDINDFISMASIANKYMLNQGVYEDTYQISGTIREFINKCMVGGRTMVRENTKCHIKEKVDDFDAVSLYPSAMKRLGEIGGYLKGKPKVIKNLTYDFLKKQDGYYVEIIIEDVYKKYKFPLMSKKGETREFTNDMIGEKVYVDKISLEDLIQFQPIKFKIIKGYYYNEGRNDKILKVIEYLFNARKQKKKEKNPIESVFKLLMNSAYGKTLLKPFDTDTSYISNKKFNDYVYRNYSHIKKITPLFNGTYKIDLYKPVNTHFNNCHIGVEVLSMSKRIMNEVMCLAEDNNLNMYYQDTDSIHIDSKSVNVLSTLFKEKYNRELIGKDMGQFHTDFDSNILDGNLSSKESIFLGKKCYIDVLQGDKSGDKVDYHIRMKGVSNIAIKHKAKKDNCSILDLYKKLYSGKKIKFDLACDGEKCCFDFKENLTISSLPNFYREIQFK